MNRKVKVICDKYKDSFKEEEKVVALARDLEAFRYKTYKEAQRNMMKYILTKQFEEIYNFLKYQEGVDIITWEDIITCYRNHDDLIEIGDTFMNFLENEKFGRDVIDEMVIEMETKKSFVEVKKK